MDVRCQVSPNQKVKFTWGDLVDFNLGPRVVPFYNFLGEDSPTKIDYRQKGTLFLTSLLEDLATERLPLINADPLMTKLRPLGIKWGPCLVGNPFFRYNPPDRQLGGEVGYYSGVNIKT